MAFAGSQDQSRFNRAMALLDAGAADAARREFEHAVEQHPDHADAWAQLALLAAQRGDVMAGRNAAQRALAIDPRDVIARLALILCDVERKAFAAAEAQLHILLRGPALSPVNLAFVHSLAGDVLDGQGKPAEAFNAYAASKAVLRDAFAAAYAGGENVQARERRLGDYVRRSARDAWTGPPGDRMPVFLVGFPRSGTTLLETVLASHPDVEALEERPCLVDAARDFGASDADLDRFIALPDVTPWRDAYWQRVAQTGLTPSLPVFLDKLPLNLPFLPLVARLFPGAKILLALRDPRDVVLSCFRRRFGMNQGMYEFTSLQSTAAYYDAVMALVPVYQETLGLDFLTTRHEDLLADFDSEARRICAFLGLDFCPQMRGFAARAAARNIDTPSSAQVARGLTTAGAGQWRRYQAQLAPVLPILAPWVARFGYPL